MSAVLDFFFLEVVTMATGLILLITRWDSLLNLQLIVKWNDIPKLLQHFGVDDFANHVFMVLTSFETFSHIQGLKWHTVWFIYDRFIALVDLVQI